MKIVAKARILANPATQIPHGVACKGATMNRPSLQIPVSPLQGCDVRSAATQGGGAFARLAMACPGLMGLARFGETTCAMHRPESAQSFPYERRPQRNRRRGAIYVIVLASSLIVGVLGLAALTLVRIQRRQADDVTDLRRARQYARAAIEMGRFRIKMNSNWRTTYSNGIWEQNKLIDSGTYTLLGEDPVDSNLSDSIKDPVVLTGIGKSGDAVQKLQVQLDAISDPLDLLATAAHTSGLFEIKGGDALTVTGAPASTNGELKVDGTVTGDAECNTTSGGGTVTGTLTTGAPAKSMPSSGLFDLYKSRATTLTYTGDFDKHILTPTLNTYGAGLNTDGVYYVNAGNNDLKIKATRIHGTLVVNMDSGKKVHLDNAAFLQNYRADYPVLIVNGELELDLKSDSYGLLESSWSTNFNPTGAPYLGATDGDTTDSYPNEIQGLVHAMFEVKFKLTSRVRGMVISESDVRAEGTNEIVYDSALFNNPPDEYTKPPVMQVLTGSWRRIVD